MSESKTKLELTNQNQPRNIEIELPASKSIANRVLMIGALAGGATDIRNLSNARDTQTMQRLLQTPGEKTWDVLDAGTTMRFLTAYSAVTSTDKIMTGTDRMKERPIGVLVEALRLLGADIRYLENAGYPPIQIKKYSTQEVDRINVRGDISSQYISALMMIGPVLPKGLELHLQGTINSRPYIDMTMKVMKQFGAEITWEGERTITIAPTGYRQTSFKVEPDWSAASYWYSMAAFCPSQTIFIKDLAWDSIQGDRKMASIMEELGINTEFNQEGATLTQGDTRENVVIDFSDCPDIAQTICVIAAVKQVRCQMTGLESLRIKETDRISALQNELAKLGTELVEHDPHHWELLPGTKISELTGPIEIETYHDHRMAMSFAPLARLMPVSIIAPDVVNKSYPHFWKDLEKAGLQGRIK